MSVSLFVNKVRKKNNFVFFLFLLYFLQEQIKPLFIQLFQHYLYSNERVRHGKQNNCKNNIQIKEKGPPYKK